MITRSHTKGDAPSTAVYSDCERYRYALTRIWDQAGQKALFVMLNPSTATEVQNDPTVERCERRARALGFGAFRVTNIFAWRDTEGDTIQDRRIARPGEHCHVLNRETAFRHGQVCLCGTFGPFS